MRIVPKGLIGGCPALADNFIACAKQKVGWNTYWAGYWRNRRRKLRADGLSASWMRP